MKSKKTPRAADFNLDEVPDKLREKGQPLSIHRPWADALADVKKSALEFMNFEALRRSIDTSLLERIALFTMALIFLVVGGFALWTYKYNPPKQEDPVFALIAAAVAFVLGGLSLAAGTMHIVLKGRAPGSRSGSAAQPVATADAEGPRYYLVYDDGLAIVTGDGYEFLAWSEIKEVSQTWIRWEPYLTLTDRADCRFVLRKGYTHMGELRLAIVQNVNRHLLPKALKRVDGGKSIRFGPFTLSTAGLKYRERTAGWDDVKSIKILNYRGRITLRIFVKGRMLWFCDHLFPDIPNHQTFYDVLCHVAPKRLLTTSSRPRW